MPRTEIQVYRDSAILYTTYRYVIETAPESREEQSGRGTEIRWVNSGWHLDSGR